MTAPRQILPGRTQMVTRRCAQRQLLLRPSETTNAIFGYVLGVAAKRYHVAIHSFCTNCSLGRWEAFWAPASYSAVTLETPQDVLEKTAYVLANPVAAGLVRHGHDWPGLWSSPERIDGEVLEFARPAVFFADKSSMPEAVTLQLVRPPGFASTASFITPLLEALASREADAAATMGTAGRSFLGVAGALAQRPNSRPATSEPRRALNPRLACRDKWRRIEALQRLTTFLADYRAALRKWRAGIRDALFPAGTYHLRLHHGVSCAPAG